VAVLVIPFCLIAILLSIRRLLSKLGNGRRGHHEEGPTESATVLRAKADGEPGLRTKVGVVTGDGAGIQAARAVVQIVLVCNACS
jgi:hypothetical protein